MVCIFDHVFHADHQLPDCLFFNKTEAQAIMADTDIIHRLQFSVRGNVYRDSIYDYANFQCIGRDESFFDQC